METDPQRPRRHHMRLPGYDYAQAGAYFITICTHSRECLFGEMVDGSVLLNGLGEIVVDDWQRTPKVRENIRLDAFVLMPNHLHGIIVIEHGNVKAPVTRRGDPPDRPYTETRACGPAPGSVGAIVGQFKAALAKRINILRGTPGAPVWQRNYYEHVVRDEDELNEIRKYIADNLAAWDRDENNPSAGAGLRRRISKPYAKTRRQTK